MVTWKWFLLSKFMLCSFLFYFYSNYFVTYGIDSINFWKQPLVPSRSMPVPCVCEEGIFSVCWVTGHYVSLLDQDWYECCSYPFAYFWLAWSLTEWCVKKKFPLAVLICQLINAILSLFALCEKILLDTCKSMMAIFSWWIFVCVLRKV